MNLKRKLCDEVKQIKYEEDHGIRAKKPKPFTKSFARTNKFLISLRIF